MCSFHCFSVLKPGAIHRMLPVYTVHHVPLMSRCKGGRKTYQWPKNEMSEMRHSENNRKAFVSAAFILYLINVVHQLCQLNEMITCASTFDGFSFLIEPTTRTSVNSLSGTSERIVSHLSTHANLTSFAFFCSTFL